MIAAVVVVLYVVIGLAILIYFEFGCYRDWPDTGRVMPAAGCLVAIFFLPSYWLYVAGWWAWDKLRGKPDGRG